MKPIKLTMKNFGPYKNETIDFSVLKQSALFLVSGKTGSGKTMIFDAMTFALYGEATTEGRHDLDLRSQFAKDNEPASIKFQFKLNQDEYLIERQLRFYKNGNKTPTQGTVAIYKNNELVSSKGNESKAYITELLKMDANQFKQILILPQGAFKKFLFAKSIEKEKVLRSLFNTIRFNQLAEQLKDDAKEMMSFAKEVEQDVETLLKSKDIEKSATFQLDLEQVENHIQYYVNEHHLVQDKLVTLKNAIINKEQQIDAIDVMNAHISKLTEIKVKLMKMNDKSTEIQLKKVKFKKLDAIKSLVDTHSMLQKLNKKVEKLRIDKQKLQIAYDEEVEQLNVKEAAFNKLLNDKEHYESAHLYVNTTKHYNKDRYTNLAAKIKLDERTLEDLKGNIQNIDNQIDDISEVKYLISSHQQHIETFQNESLNLKEQLIELNHELKDILKNNEMYDLLKEKELQFMEVKEALHDLQHINSHQLDTTIELKEQLVLGEACPICTQVVQELPESIDGKEIKDLLNKKQKLMTEINYTTVQERIDENRVVSKIMIKEKELNEKNETINNLKKKKDDIQTTVNELEQQMEQKNKLQSEMNALQITLKYNSELFNEFKEATTFDEYNEFLEHLNKQQIFVAQYELHYNELSSVIQQLTSSIELKKQSLKHINTQLQDNEKDYNTYYKHYNASLINHSLSQDDVNEGFDEKSYFDIKKDIEQYDQQHHYLITTKKDYEQRVKNNQAVDNTPLKESLQQLLNEKDELNKKSGELENIATSFTKIYQVIEKKKIKYDEKVGKQKHYLELAKLFSGDNNKRLTLENYVLIYYLKNIIKSANIRLKKMTHSRYELIMKEGLSQGYSGLDLDIFDYYSNKPRDIASLSGGESFLTSLALALGLSDYVTQSSGGIHLESVFIDEGFGTLDAETLETAISTLIELERSGKMVGIISHVSSLKSRIPNVLYVNSDNYMSTTKFQIDL